MIRPAHGSKRIEKEFGCAQILFQFFFNSFSILFQFFFNSFASMIHFFRITEAKELKKNSKIIRIMEAKEFKNNSQNPTVETRICKLFCFHDPVHCAFFKLFCSHEPIGSWEQNNLKNAQCTGSWKQNNLQMRVSTVGFCELFLNSFASMIRIIFEFFFNSFASVIRKKWIMEAKELKKN